MRWAARVIDLSAIHSRAHKVQESPHRKVKIGLYLFYIVRVDFSFDYVTKWNFRDTFFSLSEVNMFFPTHRVKFFYFVAARKEKFKENSKTGIETFFTRYS